MYSHNQPTTNTYYNNCTFNKNKFTSVVQMMANCYDCSRGASDLVCMGCIQSCHKGHTLGPMLKMKGVCYCGSSNMCSKLNNNSMPFQINNPFRDSNVGSDVLCNRQLDATLNISATSPTIDNRLMDRSSMFTNNDSAYDPYQQSTINNANFSYNGTNPVVDNSLR